MAKKKQNEVPEQEVTDSVELQAGAYVPVPELEQETYVDDGIEELTEEQQAIANALIVEDHITALKELQARSSERLATVIATFLALSAALGDGAPATQHALANLQEYKPEIAKAPKEPKFNEGKELTAALVSEKSVEALSKLKDDKRVSAPLNIAITTYLTLIGIEGIGQAVIDAAKITLQNFSKKAGKSSPANREQFNVKTSDGKIYNNLTAALEGNGIHKGTIIEVNGKKHDVRDWVWRQVRPRLLADGVATYKDVTYTKVEVSPNAIGSIRKAAPVVEPGPTPVHDGNTESDVDDTDESSDDDLQYEGDTE